ncbi:MAG TPA: lamin tail domain-containing protein, partial [Polyangiaceae bacterium]|nr:lamin tail domain-containing protein [Polyangiaceae bacterium]
AAGGVLIDPSPLVELPGLAPLVPAQCADPCVAFGPGCVCAEDDRAVITGPNEAAFWVLELGGRSTTGETAAELPFVVTELLPGTSHSLTGAVFDRAGRGTEVAARFRTGPPRARVVINEVYANSAGPEPEQEWVELTNAGTLSTTLAGYVLEDVGGAAVLPDVELARNAHAVLVNASYSPDPEHDAVPPADALVVVVERLGKSGLSNEGEALRLVDPDGEIVSRFPGLRASEPGISLARRTPWADDAAADAFAAHGAPGASPGMPNFFDAPE